MSNDSTELTEGELAEIAKTRWFAVQGMVCARLSKSARLLGTALIFKMNGQTRECYPSEAFLAGLLGFDLSTVKRAKSELRRAGLVNWTVKGRLHICYYRFDFEKLTELALAAREDGRAAADGRQSRAAVPLQSGANAPLQRVTSDTLSGDRPISQSGTFRPQSGKTDLQSGNSAPHRGAPAPPNHRRNHLNESCHYQRSGGAPRAEGKTNGRRTPFARVEAALKDSPALLDTFLAMDSDGQAHTSFLLASPKHGIDAAKAYVAEKDL